MTNAFLMQSIRNVFSCHLVEKCSPKGYGTKVEVKLIDENLWLTQEQIVSLYNSSKSNISEHIKHILEEGELVQEATVRKFRTVQKEGEREVGRNIAYIHLESQGRID